jgi:hypothetical protein
VDMGAFQMLDEFGMSVRAWVRALWNFANELACTVSSEIVSTDKFREQALSCLPPMLIQC